MQMALARFVFVCPALGSIRGDFVVEVGILVIVTGMLGSSYTHMHDMSLTLSWIFPGGFFSAQCRAGIVRMLRLSSKSLPNRSKDLMDLV
jgi:hypothetical protein